MQISLMVTCLGDIIRPAAGKATVRLLRRLGQEIDFPAAQTCCGQPFYNSGYSDLARESARHTLQTFDHGRIVVTPSGSCAAMVRLEYPHLFEDDPAWHERAKDLAARTYELSEFLVRKLGVTDVGARYEGKVAFHYACHLRGLGVTDEPLQLLRAVHGLELMPFNHDDQCCGFGGSFALRYPEISTAMVQDKTRCLTASGARTVVSTDAGCLMNIGGRLQREGQSLAVLHLAEVLDSQGAL